MAWQHWQVIAYWGLLLSPLALLWVLSRAARRRKRRPGRRGFEVPRDRKPR